MNYIVELGVKHLLVDFPSVDRLLDEGRLTCHNIFWETNNKKLNLAARGKTITEMIFVSNDIIDGKYLLNIQTPSFVSDAPPSKPIILKLMKYSTDKSFCEELDQKDSLKSYKDLFFIPKNKQGKELIYFCGNSLGLQQKKQKNIYFRKFDDWKTHAVEGHFHAKNPWLPYHEMLSASYSKLIGAKSSEVIAMNTLTVNLHLMMVSFYKPEKNKFKILIGKGRFSL